MLSFFRRLINSRIGIVITFVALGIIALAFAAGDVTGLRNSATGGMSRSSVATVGDASVGVADLRQRTQNELEALQQQEQQSITMAQFIDAGGMEGTLGRIINGLALEQFGHAQGMAMSKRAVDGLIAGLPAFQGPDGKFSQTLYETILRGRHLSDAEVRDDLARETLAQQLIAPTVGATQVPQQVALPYAALLLEKRHGTIAFIPAKAVPQGAAPTDAELQQFYTRQIAHYTLPERRVMRYAVVTPDSVKAQSVPSDAEVAAAYAAARASYAPSEKRTVTQVAVIDQAAAGALASKVKGGTPIAAAARAAGLESRTLTSLNKADYAAQTSPSLADGVFGAAKGTVVGPVRGPIGYVIVHVDTVVQDPGRTLAEATPDLVKTLTRQKTQAAMARIHDALDDAGNGNATFDELAGDQKLAAQTTPALVSTGANPDDPTAKVDPAIAQIAAAGFAADQGDPPQVVATAADGSFALVALDRIVAAAPRPLAQVKADVTRDYTVDRAAHAARAVASTVLGKVEHGTALASALAQTGLTLPPAKPVDVTRAQLSANPQGAPAPLVLMFSMAPKTAKVLEAPNQAGWLVVYLETIDKGDAAGNPSVLAATRQDLGRVIGREYAEQFGAAVRQVVGVKRNADAIAKVRADLTGAGGSDQP